ncbi:MAG: GNAT family N-acetyltransferase [Armatimonadetes bacterium]|nr:MAG: GNAT family N-acetyltransferase [Armatimonadota bacterium]
MSGPTLSSDWKDFPVEGQSTAPRTGPFPFRPFLETVWKHRTDRAAELVVSTTEDSAVALAVSGDSIEFAGEADLTDYHAPVGEDSADVLAKALSVHRDHAFRFDSLPIEATAGVLVALNNLEAPFTKTEHAGTAVLDLPETFDEWLMGIGKKERHEVRRKRRRFEAEFGPVSIVPGNSEAFATFCSMHRTSEGEKGSFMTDSMEQYFSDLVANTGAVVHALVCNDRTLATAFGWETEDGYYFYNSAFDPSAAFASPGVVLFSSMIEAEITRGAKVFDFLKGDERYKFRHGAEARPLFAIEGRIP